jgi:hypothetical protein
MIPVNITKPNDIAVIFAIFALVIVTVGFGVTSIIDQQQTVVDNSYFTSVQVGVTGEEGLKGAADSMSTGLSGTAGTSNTPSTDNILVSGFNSMLRLGKTFRVMSDSLMTGTTILGIDPIYWMMFTSVLLISFAVVMYTWLRKG